MAITVLKIQRFILRSIVPIICSIAVGFIFNQEYVFYRQSPAFQFVWSGVVASVFYYLLISVRSRDALLGFILLLFLTFVTTQSTRIAFVLRDVFYVAGIGASVFIYFKYFREHSPDNYLHPPFMLAGIYATCFILSSEISLAIVRNFFVENIAGNVISLASSSAFFGTLVGFAVGSGIAINEKFFGGK
jgi:hypothetical protein